MKKHFCKSVQVGLIGAGIQASRSPQLHEGEARAAGIDCSYQLIDLAQLGVGVESLPQLLDAAQQQGFAGVNITHPCKQSVIPLLDELSEDAATIGAVNTVVFSAGKRIGHNTDCWGFAESFRRGLADVVRDQVVLLGAGGAGSAVASAALQIGVTRLVIHDVDCTRAIALAERLRARFGADRIVTVTEISSEMAAADGLIQATPIGMLGHPGLPLPIELLRPAHWVAEIVYFPLETELLKLARLLGCRTLDGSGMVVFQAAEAFRLFTGVAPDYERMLRCFASLN
ncbi:MAG TPA: shikimate dehydrogenase [Blastocatellia bacterium]|nr:shikimate dehydrogenase [Blastocatellia bacterium]